MERSILESYIQNGLTTREIALAEKVSQTTINYWLKKFGLNTNWKRGAWSKTSSASRNPKKPQSLLGWDWEAIQTAHNQGSCQRMLCKKFHLTFATLAKAKRQGLFKPRTLKESSQLSHDSGHHDYSIYRTESYKRLQSRLGGYKPRSGRSKGAFATNLEGREFWLQSSYEVEMATLLNEMGLLWERPEGLPYQMDGKDRRYYADFILPKHRIYLDTKNDYLFVLDAPKIKAVVEQNQVNLVVVKKPQITREFIASLLPS